MSTIKSKSRNGSHPGESAVSHSSRFAGATLRKIDPDAGQNDLAIGFFVPAHDHAPVLSLAAVLSKRIRIMSRIKSKR